MKYIIIGLLLFAFSADAVPPPRGIDPVEAKKRERKQRIEREKARRDSIWCYIKERKKNEDRGFNCIYKCPTKKNKNRIENNNVGPGFSCPTRMNVLRRE